MQAPVEVPFITSSQLYPVPQAMLLAEEQSWQFPAVPVAPSATHTDVEAKQAEFV
jgi:hypothetical protein